MKYLITIGSIIGASVIVILVSMMIFLATVMMAECITGIHIINDYIHPFFEKLVQ